jgi:hypothetical protein
VNERAGLGLIDSHAHIQGSEYASEVEAVIERAGRRRRKNHRGWRRGRIFQ